MADTKTYTPNYNLVKPGQDDFYNIDDFNDNADIIDGTFKAHVDATAGVHGVTSGSIESTTGAQTKVDTAISNHVAAANPHPGYATNLNLSNHVAATDPHTGYMLANGARSFTGDLNMGGNRITGLVGGIEPNDIAIIAQVADVYNFSFERFTNGKPDEWDWVAYEGGACEEDVANGVIGAKCVKITHPGGINIGGGMLTTKRFIPINRLVNDYWIEFAVWSSVAGIKNDIQLLFYDKDFVLLNTISTYSSTINPTSAVLFISQIPSIPANSKYCKIRLIGGNITTSTGGITQFDAVCLFKSLHRLQSINGTIPTFTESTKMSDTNFTDAIANLAITSEAGRRLGYLPCSISKVIQGAATGIKGEARLRCGTEYGPAVEIGNGTYNYLDYTLSLTITNPNPPMLLAVQFRTKGNDWVGVKNNVANTTIIPSRSVF